MSFVSKAQIIDTRKNKFSQLHKEEKINQAKQTVNNFVYENLFETLEFYLRKVSLSSFSIKKFWLKHFQLDKIQGFCFKKK